MNTVLRFDRGTLLLEGGEPRVTLRGSFIHDPRVDAWRAPAMSYSTVIPSLRGRLEKNTAPRYRKLSLEPRLTLDLYPHQEEALEQWKAARGRGLGLTEPGLGLFMRLAFRFQGSGTGLKLFTRLLKLRVQPVDLLKPSSPLLLELLARGDQRLTFHIQLGLDLPPGYAPYLPYGSGDSLRGRWRGLRGFWLALLPPLSKIGRDCVGAAASTDEVTCLAKEAYYEKARFLPMLSRARPRTGAFFLFMEKV